MIADLGTEHPYRQQQRFYGATEDQLRRLERRVAKLEQLVAEMAAKATAGERAA
jgi:hypothetical protein